MQSIAYIGIDPGNNGGIALYRPSKSIGMIGIKMPTLPIITNGKKKTIIDVEVIKDLLDMVFIDSEKVVIAIEKVGAMPNQGVTSMFNFGVSYGILLGIAKYVTKDVITVLPQTWKKKVLDIDHTKTGSIEFSQRRFPMVNLTPDKKEHRMTESPMRCVLLIMLVLFS